jgi:hypothetical protein
MLAAGIALLVTLGIADAPVESFKEAVAKYGPLDLNYKMIVERKHIVEFSFEPYGFDWKTRLNKDLVTPLKFVFTELKARGLTKELTKFNGCYVSRSIRGSKRPSTHAFGLACDFDHKPYSKEFVEVWRRYGFTWGGDWCNGRDYMHFSFAYEQPATDECRYHKDEN